MEGGISRGGAEARSGLEGEGKVFWRGTQAEAWRKEKSKELFFSRLPFSLSAPPRLRVSHFPLQAPFLSPSKPPSFPPSKPSESLPLRASA